MLSPVPGRAKTPRPKEAAMNRRFLLSLLALFLLSLALWAPAALAQLTVVTDQDQYTAGEVVLITVHNAGPNVATFSSYPGYFIEHVESHQCVDGCVGLPVLWDLAVGETVHASHDTGVEPDLIGTYDVALMGSSGDPGSILIARYELVAPVSATATTWGGIKSLFR
jgi:hypothetical protein